MFHSHTSPFLFISAQAQITLAVEAPQISISLQTAQFIVDFIRHRRRNVKNVGGPALQEAPLCFGVPPARGLTACGPVAIVHSSWPYAKLLDTNRYVISLCLWQRSSGDANFLNSGEKKTVKNWQNTRFCHFWIFAQNGQMLSDLNSETRFGIMRHHSTIL